MRERTREFDVAALVGNIEELLATCIFSSTEASGPLFKSAYAWLILNLDALLAEADRRGHRVSVDMLDADSASDVTDLVGRARYAIVHTVGGDKYRTGSAGGQFDVAVGAASGFDDDIAVTTGAVRVLIRRHAVTAFERVRGILSAGG